MASVRPTAELDDDIGASENPPIDDIDESYFVSNDDGEMESDEE